MEYMQKPIAQMPVQAPFDDMGPMPFQAPLQVPIQAPLVAAVSAPVPCFPPFFTTAGVILVLFILLVIVSRRGKW